MWAVQGTPTHNARSVEFVCAFQMIRIVTVTITANKHLIEIVIVICSHLELFKIQERFKMFLLSYAQQ